MNEIEKQQEIEEFLRYLASAIECSIGLKFNKEEIGFALLLFEFNNPDIGNYISNANRKDMIKSLRETADRLEKNQDIPPTFNKTIQ